MKRICFAAAAMLATPFIGHAGPATEAAGSTTKTGVVIDLEYWGTVTEATSRPRSVGDAVHGMVRIDTRVAPPDFSFYFPEWAGEYDVNQECPRNCLPERTEPSGFVTSPGIKDLGGPVYDRVRVIDSDLDPLGEWDRDEYSVRDYEIRPYAEGAGWQQLEIGVASPLDFIMGDGLVQSFDLRPAESGGGALGQFVSFLDGVASGFSFAIERIRATPHVCRP
jgi:hypothetical protein